MALQVPVMDDLILGMVVALQREGVLSARTHPEHKWAVAVNFGGTPEVVLAVSPYDGTWLVGMSQTGINVSMRRVIGLSHAEAVRLVLRLVVHE